MQLWTYHPANFRLDDPRPLAHLDPALGPYWNDPTLCYERSLRRLLKTIGVEQFPLWCFVAPDCWGLPDVCDGPTEWELAVPESDVLTFIRSHLWDAILKGHTNSWHDLIVMERPVALATDITAIVQFPLLPHWNVINHGRVVPKPWKNEANNLKRRPQNEKRQRIQSLRDNAADPANVAPSLDAGLADYLDEIFGLGPNNSRGCRAP